MGGTTNDWPLAEIISIKELLGKTFYYVHYVDCKLNHHRILKIKLMFTNFSQQKIGRMGGRRIFGYQKSSVSPERWFNHWSEYHWNDYSQKTVQAFQSRYFTVVCCFWYDFFVYFIFCMPILFLSILLWFC